MGKRGQRQARKVRSVMPSRQGMKKARKPRFRTGSGVHPSWDFSRLVDPAHRHEAKRFNGQDRSDLQKATPRSSKRSAARSMAIS